MFRSIMIILATLVLNCLLGCGAHAPRPSHAPMKIEDAKGTVVVCFSGNDWLPSSDADLATTAHMAVYGLMEMRMEELGGRFRSGGVHRARVSRRDADGTVCVSVPWDAEVAVPAN